MEFKIEQQGQQNVFRVTMADGSPIPQQSPAAVRDIVLTIKEEFGVDAQGARFENWPVDGGTRFVLAIVSPHR